jgi:hypothetical protein
MSVLHVGFVASHVSTCMCYATQCFVFNGAWPCTQKRTKLARVSRLFFVLKAWARPDLVTLIEVRLLSCILKHHRALDGATLCVIGYHCCTCRLCFVLRGLPICICSHSRPFVVVVLFWLIAPARCKVQVPATVLYRFGGGPAKCCKGHGQGGPGLFWAPGGPRTFPFRRRAAKGCIRHGAATVLYRFGGVPAKGCFGHGEAPVLYRFGGGEGKGCKGHGAAPVLYRFGGGPAKGCFGHGAVPVLYRFGGRPAKCCMGHGAASLLYRF